MMASIASGPEASGSVTMKDGLIGLARSIAHDFGKHGVRCNAICPGWVKTKADSGGPSEPLAELSLGSSKSQTPALLARAFGEDTLVAGAGFEPAAFRL